MSGLEVCLFGRFTVRCGDQVVSGMRPRKVQELFAYLLLNRDRPQHREILADLLWNDSPSARSRKCLRQALWRLQAVLGAHTDRLTGGVLLVEHDWIQLNPEAELWLDVGEFEEAFDLVHGAAGQELDARRAQMLEDAVRVYQGDLLEGWYQDWCVYERERVQQMYFTMLDKLMGYCEARQQYESGLLYGTRILRHEPARERTHRRLVRLHCLSGDRTSALRQYQHCVVALEEELGVRPSQRTTALYESIRNDRLDQPHTA